MRTLLSMKSKTTELLSRFWVSGYLVLAALLVFLHALAYPSSSSAQEADGTNCPSGVTGLCTPGVFESSTETVTETIETDATGTTTTTTTTTETTETTVTNEDTTNLLETGGGHVSGSKEGDMNQDWGGQGPGSIRSGATGGDLGTDSCSQITGSGSITSTLGVPYTSATYRQTINLSSFNFDRGGKTNYTIKVHKQDDADSITMSIRGLDGTTTTFTGNDTLSAAGVASGFQTYTGGFNFSGCITSIIVEVAGKNFNAAIGPVFDDVTVNVLFNVVSTIVTQTITTVEEFVALGIFDQETINVAEDLFDNNNITQNDMGEVTIEPISSPEPENTGPTFESVEMEIQTEIEMPQLTVQMDMPAPPPVEVQTSEQTVEVEIETEMQNDINDNMAANQPVESAESSKEGSEGATSEPIGKTEESKPEPETKVSETKEEPESESTSVDEPEETEEVEVAESKPEPKPTAKAKVEKKQEKPKTKTEKKQEAKQKAASKIVKKMGDKGRYDDSNQIKTLVVMQVLGNTKSFFANQTQLPDTAGFFDDSKIPDAQISDNNAAAYFMIGGSNAAHNALVESQYK